MKKAKIISIITAIVIFTIFRKIENFKNLEKTKELPAPKIEIQETTGIIDEWVEYAWLPRKFIWEEIIGKNWERRTGAIITWYQYIYTYSDLWIKIWIKNTFLSGFYTIPNDPVFIREWNKILLKWEPENYVEMFHKDPKESLLDIIKREDLASGCEAFVRQEYGPKDPNMRDFKLKNLIYITGKDWSLSSDIYGNVNCKPDKEQSENTSMIYFIQNPNHPDLYYKISQPDGCAPTCGSFNILEFF